VNDLVLGFIMGIANLLPGISGGTIAFVSGRYPDIVGSLSNLMRFKFKKDEVLLLIRIGIGAAVAIFSLSKLVDYLYTNFPVKTSSFFAGLVAGGLFLLWREIRLNVLPSVMMVLGVLGMVGISNVNAASSAEGNLRMMFGGFLAGGTMILPGISGSSMLVVLGIYEKAISAVSNLNTFVLFLFGVSAIVGMFVFSYLMKNLLDRWKNETMAFLYGLTLAGLFYIISSGVSLVLLLIGFSTMLILDRII
jgi:putative membrane protein